MDELNYSNKDAANSPPSYEESNANQGSGFAVAGVPMQMNYVRSKAGYLRIAEMILGLIVAICAGTAASNCFYYSCGAAGYLMRVAIGALICSIVLFIIFAFGLTEKIWFIHWPATELINCLIFFVNYFIGSIWLAANIERGTADTAAVIFGFVTVAAYAGSTYLSFIICRDLYRQWQDRRHGRSSRAATTQVTTTTTIEVNQY